MRRVLLLAVAALSLALAAPSGALAHHGHHGHHKHKHHKAHKAKHRLKHIAAKPAHSDDPGDAGTVASFTDGVLTITLADGSTVSGKVTDRTEIDCTVAEPAPTPTATVSHYGGDHDDDDWRDDDHRWRHHCGDDADCDVSDLVPGAVVHEAELRIGPGGSEFKEIELVVQSEQTT